VPVFTSDDHQLFDQVSAVFLVHLDSTCLELLDCAVYDTDRALNNELPRIDLCLGGLNLQEGGCDLWCVCRLHNFKAEHLDAADVTLVLHKLAHTVAD
jgi:hypothetical protein